MLLLFVHHCLDIRHFACYNSLKRSFETRGNMSKNKAAILLLILSIVFFSGCPNPTPSSNPPAAPDSLTATGVSATSVQLSWSDKSDNESGFEVEGSATGGQFSLLGTTAADAKQYLATGLTPQTGYSFRVRAVGSDGKSAYSNTASATTPAVVPNAPSNLVATSSGATSINLTWTDNSTDETGFIIERSAVSSTTGFSQIAALAANTTGYPDTTGLSATTPYWYRVKAAGTAGNDSAWSNVATATTSVTPPAAPTNLVATASSSYEIDLTWTDNSGNETGFTLERSSVSDTTGFSEVSSSIAANAVSYNDTNGSAGTIYWYRIKATNAGGPSGYSNTASAATFLLNPTGLTATAIGPDSISLAWTDNSANETGFIVQRSSTGSTSGFDLVTTTAANATTYTDASSLSVNTTYWYRVSAAGPAGNNSAWSSTASAKTLLQAPTGLTLSVQSMTSIKLDWVDNSTAESGFRVERSSTSGTTGFALVTTTAINITTYTNTGLSGNTTYWYRVRANASAGNNSLWSNVPSATTTQALPAPTNLTATAPTASSVHLAWTDNSTGETGFGIETSTTSGTTGFAALTTVGANVVSYDQTTGITAGQQRWYRVKAVGPSGNDSAWSNVPFVVPSPVGTFKVANSWGANDGTAKWENIQDGFYFITYQAVINASMYALFFEDKAAYNPTLLVTFGITHPKKGDCTIVVGLGSHTTPFKTKTFYNYGITGDAIAFPSNVMALDISEFAADINSYDLFLKVTDSNANPDIGSINSFTLEKYTTYGGTKATYASYSTLPMSTVDGGTVYADIYTAGIVGTPSPLALSLVGQSRIANLVNSHRMTDAELSQMKRIIGVAEKGKNYNKIINGHGTGLRPPTEEQWARIQQTTRIVDSLKSGGPLGAPLSVDLSALKSFPPIGNQGSQGSCASWSTTYYIKTFQEALEHNWDLSTVKMIGSWPHQPDSMQDKLFSPNFVYHQINGGADTGSYSTDNTDILSNIGAASWQTFPYYDTDKTSWPSEAAWREAPLYRSNIPAAGDYGMAYSVYITSAAQITILKTLLENNIPISISVNADLYQNLTAQDVWNETNYQPTSTNHANTIVGYFDQ